MAVDLVRLEVWSDLECASGTRLGFYQPLPVSATWTREINGEDRLHVELHRDVDAWSLIQRDRVLRARLRDGTYHEFRVGDVGEAHERDGRLVAELEADAPLYDLGADLIAKRSEGGDVTHDFPLASLTPTEHLNVILGKTAGFPGPAAAWWSLGTVDFTTRVDLNYRGLTALEALHELVGQVTDSSTGIGAEIEVVRTGTSGYSLGLRQTLGASAERAYLRHSRNLHSLRRAEVGEDVPSRVYPFGQDLGDARFDMGDARWEVASVSSNDVALQGSPIGFDDQFNQLYLERPDGQKIEIADTVLATQVLTLASAPGLVPGDLVWIRKNAAGDELTYLDRPGAARVRQERLERPDVPPADNLVANPFLNDWAAGLPVGWNALGGATLAQVTEGGKVLHGSSSAQIVALSEEAGIETDWIDVDPTTARPHFLGQVALFPVEGVWRFEIFCDDGGVGFTIPDDVGDGVRAYTSVTGAWVERLSIQDQATNFAELGVTRVKLRLLADRLDAGSGQASCYFDAAQICQTHLPELPFYDGRASRALWRAANDRLAYVADGAFRLDVGIVDLHRIDESRFPHDELVLGGAVEVQDPKLGVVAQTRIRKLKLELMQPGASEVELSDRPDELVDVSRLPLERRPGTLKPGGSGTSAVDGNPLLDEDAGSLFLHPRKLPGARSIGYYDSDTPIDDATLLNNLTPSDDASILVHTFSGAEGEKRYVSLAYFPALGAKGKVGRIHHLTPHEFNTADSLPSLSHQVLPAPDKDDWRIVVTITDDADQVYGEHRWYVDGAAPGAFTRNPSSGTVSDPHSFSFDVPKPATDSAPDHIVEVYGYDDAGNRSRLLYLIVERNQVISGNQLMSVWLEETVGVLDTGGGFLIPWRAIDLHWQTLSETVTTIDWTMTLDGNPYAANPSGTIVTGGATSGRQPITGGDPILPEAPDGTYRATCTPKDIGSNPGPSLATTDLIVPTKGKTNLEDEDAPGTIQSTSKVVIGEGLVLAAGGTVRLKATRSTSGPTGTPADGELWLEYLP